VRRLEPEAAGASSSRSRLLVVVNRRRSLRQVAVATPHHAIDVLKNARIRWFDLAAVLLSLPLRRILRAGRTPEQPSQPTRRMHFATPRLEGTIAHDGDGTPPQVAGQRRDG
jgi:hypothetical protein